MSDSREDSPDWLRCFEAPRKPILTLSSDSDSSPSSSPRRKGDSHKEEPPLDEKSQLPKKDQNQETILIDSAENTPVRKAPKKRGKVETDEKSKSPRKRVKFETEEKKLVKDETDNPEEGNDVKGEVAKKGTSEKKVEPHLQISSRMPLVISDKVQRTKVLVECEGESMDMSGDVGAVGRIIVSDAPSKSGNPEMLFDLKGTIYKTTIVPSRTFCVVSFAQTEAKIEAVMNDFIQLKPQSNVYEAETMIEGTLDGFSFDSEEEAEKVPKPNARQNDKDNNEADDVKADKASGGTRKKGKTAAKPPKKGKRKTAASKKAKNSKK